MLITSTILRAKWCQLTLKNFCAPVSQRRPWAPVPHDWSWHPCHPDASGCGDCSTNSSERHQALTALPLVLGHTETKCLSTLTVQDLELCRTVPAQSPASQHAVKAGASVLGFSHSSWPCSPSGERRASHKHFCCTRQEYTSHAVTLTWRQSRIKY